MSHVPSRTAPRGIAHPYGEAPTYVDSYCGSLPKQALIHGDPIRLGHVSSRYNFNSFPSNPCFEHGSVHCAGASCFLGSAGRLASNELSRAPGF